MWGGRYGLVLAIWYGMEWHGVLHCKVMTHEGVERCQDGRWRVDCGCQLVLQWKKNGTHAHRKISRIQ
jgi:hypothetical protein